MTVIHGSWLIDCERDCFFVWGETWRSLVNIDSISDAEGSLVHPFCLSETELSDFFTKNNLSLERVLNSKLKDIWTTKQIAIPTVTGKSSKMQPVYADDSTSAASESSLEKQVWQVEGFCLTPLEAIALLQMLSLNSLQADNNYLSGELQYATHIYRWTLDLIVRQKYLPGIERGTTIKSVWQPLLDSETDRVRFARFVRLMPPACLAYGSQAAIEPQTLLLRSLSVILDARLRTWSDFNAKATKNISIQPWLRSLVEFPSTLETDRKNISRLDTALYNWTLPINEYLINSQNDNFGRDRYRVCLVLQPPEVTEKNGVQSDWQLNYYLQALDRAEFRVKAATIWQCEDDSLTVKGRTIESPQAALLKGLGLASRIYAPIKASLEQSNPISCQLDPIQVYEFIRSIAWQLQNSGLGIILPPGLASGDSEQRLGIKITAGVATKKRERLSLESLLKYKLEIAVGDRSVSQQDFQRLLDQKSPIVEIEGQWLALQPADVKAAQAVLSDSNEQMNLSVEDALRLSTGDTNVLAKLPVTKFESTGILKELINNLTDNKAVEPVNNIKGFKGELRPYQAKGVGWLSFLETWGLGACLADDMGLGKTIELIAFLLNLKQQDILTKPTLLICPTSVLNNWQREVRKFAPDLKTVIHHGDKRSKGKTFAREVKDKQLVITSYSLVHRDLKTLEAIDWQGVVLDEAQNIKNSAAKQSQAVRQVKAGFRIALTGTPVENRLSELWSILDFLNPGFLGKQTFFQKRFAIPIEKYGDRDSLNTLRSLVRPFILRRLKTDKNIIQDLPEKQEMNVFCGLSAEQAELYQKLVDKSLNEIEDSEGIKRKGLILTLLLRLKQLCNHPELVEKSKGKIKIDSATFGNRSGKLLRLEEMLAELIAEGDRALIFTQFSEWGKMLKPYLETKLNSEVLFLYGATRREARQEMVDRFQNDPNGSRIFILSLKAGGTGLNLTRANHVFHVDRWWNPAVENQATDRAFRIGQKRNVQVHKFVCTGTLEERINDIIESKKELAEQTVNAGEQWLTKLDSDRLRNLLLLDRDAIIDD
ncbi:DEAD/DEAH box helicase [Myxosarcina sp. GI1]|uniref:DEAD/DEAH box helicase n=1 Tax=Myxosarcina sp. GI1 TaxID=1541065 RepID=UPI00055A24C0|nr:DEAD/DEAH box helicase [Myxosarcina sp. GI1]